MSVTPSVLILSNKFDFSTDLIAIQLAKQGISYLRLNRDQLELFEIELDPSLPRLQIRHDSDSFTITENTLKSIYFRAPTFLRDIFQEKSSPDEQLYRTQWASFIRCLAIFENVKWVNNPVSTYNAENKPLQLLYAKKAGFAIPETTITNYTNEKPQGVFAIKSLDTAIIHADSNEAFIYTRLVEGNSLQSMRYNAPFIMQRALVPKIDIRVTVVGKTVIAIRLDGESGIDIDWRRYQGKISYTIFELPENIEAACISFSKSLNLHFAAIDLILHNEIFYFIEVNPTGEWSWLQKNTNYPFDILITKSLLP